MSRSSNPNLEAAAFCLIVFVFCFDHIMRLILKTLGYCALVIGVILALAGSLGLLWRILRGIGNLIRRKHYLDTMEYIHGTDKEERHERA